MNLTSSWIDQSNTIDHLHALEKKMFERALELDDKMIGSKAADIESKVVTDRKAGGEGPVCDAICDSFFQIILGMRLQIISDNQQQNVEKVLDFFPSSGNYELSVSSPVMACDFGYGKLPVVELLA